jgi:hypothetical protein
MRSGNCRKKRFSRCISVLIALVTLSACATLPTPPAGVFPRPALAPANDGAWWFARFRMDWPEGVDPAWHLDLMTAHRIIKPVIDAHSQGIYLWRFHRRAARDAAGHQFSFIFFASPETARTVYAEIDHDSALAQVRSAGRIREVIYDDPAVITRPAIRDTSDPNWSSAIQSAWPYYLMGASQMWLKLISGMADEEHPTQTPASLEGLERKYSGINSAITSLWQNEGRHAFLHHLNALFGYEPLIIIEKRPMRF